MNEQISVNRRAWRDRPPLLSLVLFYAAYVLAGGFGQGLAIIPGVSITFWPPAGIFVAMLLLHDKKGWPWWIAAACLAELTCNAIWFHSRVPLALIYFAANALEALAAAWAIRRFTGKPFRLETLEEVAAFVALGAIVAPVIGATVIATTDALLGKHPFWTAWPLVWLGDGTGLLVSTPLALVAVQTWRERLDIPLPRLIEALILLVVLAAIGALTFSGRLPTAFMTMPPLLWAAARFQLKGAAAALALIALMEALFTVSGKGAFAGDPEAVKANVVLLQTFFGISAVSALVVAALSQLYRKALLNEQTAKAELELRVAERTADLRDSRARLQSAIEIAGLSSYSWDPATGALHWDARLKAMFGLPADAHVDYDIWRNAVHPDDRDRALASVAHSLDPHGDGLFEAEYRVIGASDGVERWVAARGQTFFAGGKPAGFIGTARDITERKRAEESLLRSQRLLRAATDNASVGLVSLDRERRYTFANPAYLKVLGLPPNLDLLGKGPAEILAPVYAEQIAPRLDRAFAGERVSYELKRPLPDGPETRFAYHSVVYEPVQDESGNVTGIVVVIFDITERKQAEAALERYRLMSEHSRDINLFFRPDGEIVTANPAAVAAYGYPLEELAGKSFYDIRAPETHADLTAQLAQVQREGSLRFESVHVRKDGSRFPIEANWTYAVIDGEPLIFTLVRDIAERKQAEEALRASETFSRGVLEASPDCVKVIAPEGRLEFMNAHGMRQMEIDDFGLCAGAPWASLWPEQTRQTIADALAAARNGDETHFEAFCPTAKGTPKWWDVAVTPVLDGLGRCTRIVSVSRDVTERKEAEKRLRDSEERNRFLVESTSDTVFRMGLYEPLPVDAPENEQVDRIFQNGFIQSSNDAFAKAYGYQSAAEVAGQPFTAFVPRTPENEAMVRAVVASGHRIVEAQTEELGKQGQRKVMLNTIIGKIENGHVVDYFGTARDITERKEAEDALRDSEQRLRAIFNHQFQFSGLLTPDGKIVDISESALRNMNASRQAIIGQDFIELPGFNRLPETQERWRRQFAEALSGERAASVEAPYHAPDGSLRHAINTVTVLRDDEGKVKFFLVEGIDITERKQAEEALRGSEERYRLALQTGRLAVWDTDMVTGVRRWAPEAMALFDLDLKDGLGQFGGAGDELLARMHPEDRGHLADYHRLSSDHDTFPTEFRIVRGDGEVRWMAGRGTITERDSEGRPTKAISIMADITERKQAENALREAQRFNQGLIDAVPTMLYIYDLVERRNVFMSPQIEAVLGVSLQEIQNAGPALLAELFHPDDLPRIAAHHQALREEANTGPRTIEYRMRNRDGSWRWLLSLDTVYERDSAGRGLRILGSAMDITERKQTEDALRDSESQLRLALDAAKMGVWDWDIVQDRLAWDEAQCGLYGVDPKTFTPSYARLLEFIDPQDRERLQAEAEAAYRVGNFFQSEFRIRRADGETRWIAASSMLLKNPAGEPLRMVGVNFDMTERKRHEEHLRLMINELNHRVKNTLATIQSMAGQTLRNSADMAEAKERLEGRLMSLSKAHDVLTREKWESAPLGDVVERAIAPYRSAGPERFTVEGPALRVSPRFALAIAMALHELATNAVKYGALSNDKGKVSFTWNVSGGKARPKLKLRWVEKGGPKVEPPARKGFGSRLIERGLASDLGGEVKMTFAKSGVTCMIAAPLERKGDV